MKFLLLNLAVSPLLLLGCAHDIQNEAAENPMPYDRPLACGLQIWRFAAGGQKHRTR